MPSQAQSAPEGMNGKPSIVSNRRIVAGYPGTMANPVRNWRVRRRSMRRPTPIVKAVVVRIH